MGDETDTKGHQDYDHWEQYAQRLIRLFNEVEDIDPKVAIQGDVVEYLNFFMEKPQLGKEFHRRVSTWLRMEEQTPKMFWSVVSTAVHLLDAN